MAGLPAWTGGTARRRRGPAASALIIAIGAAIVIVALAGGLLVLMLPDHDYIVYIASDGGRNPWDATALWPDDTTWLVSSPWG